MAVITEKTPVRARTRVIVRKRWTARRARLLGGRPRDAGMATLEYAVGTLAACALATALYRVVTSDTVSGALSELLTRALHAV